MTTMPRNAKPYSLLLRMFLLALLIAVAPVPPGVEFATGVEFARVEELRPDELPLPAVAKIGLGMAYLFDFNGYGQVAMLSAGHVLGMGAGIKIALAATSLGAAIAAPIVLPVAGAL